MEPCIHGDLCRATYSRDNYIYDCCCPNWCEFYEPKSQYYTEEDVRRILNERERCLK